MRQFAKWAVAFVAVALVSGTASAQTKTFRATLSGGAEVPPTNSAGTGNAQVTLDPASKMISWSVTYAGVSGPVVAGHIHGPAAAGANAGVKVPFTAPGTSPIRGSAKLDDAELAALESGKMYVNLHTKAHPAGEIRGQLEP